MTRVFEKMVGDEDGWTAWVHPLPGYRMQCCGCGLIHELEFEIAANSTGITELNAGESADHVIIFRAK